jgi:uncharacterized protein
MRIFVLVKTNAKAEMIECLDESHYKIAVKALPIDGKANQALIKILAKHFSVPKSRVVLKSGESSKQKVFEIL